MRGDAEPAKASPPHEVYRERRDERGARVEQLAARERTLSNLRLAVFALGVAGLWLVWGPVDASALWLVPPVVAFVALVLWHDRVIAARRHAERARAFYERGLARLEDRWIGLGEDGARFLDPHHLHAGDLDLFGRGSLFQLLCIARTRTGEETLAAWLATPAAPEEIRARQAAVAELRHRLDLREDLALLGEDVQSGLDADALVAWATAPRVAFPAASRPAAALLVLALFAAALGWLWLGMGALPFLAVLVLEGAFASALRGRVRSVLSGLGRPARDLALLASLLERLERERFDSPRLAALRALLDVEGEPPSQRVARLVRRIELLEARQNQLFAPVAALLLWATQLALAIEGWRTASGSGIPRWIAVVGEFEALSSLASHAWEHPGDPFPEILSEGPRYEAEALGHPLLPESRCVRNSLSLGAGVRLYVVSGSNMSGKSTWLRTIGTNAVLAFAGAPVRARSMRISPFVLGCSLRIVDSLQSGESKFYAEITRMRDIVARASTPPPLLFLLDEILNGTNSHDRRIGAEAIVQGLLARGAVGLVTTHDLALARIAESRGDDARNVHFEDQLVEGEMRFDYRLRPGVVEKSNALALMRAVGLEV